MSKKITDQQRKALHLWLEMLAHEANNQGLTLQDMVKVVKKLEIRPNKDNLKETFVKPYIKSAFNLDSTTQLNNQQINETYDAMNKLFSYYWHIHIPFPSDEEMQLKNLSGVRIAQSQPRDSDYPELEELPTI